MIKMIRFDTKKDMEHYDNLYHQIYEKQQEIERLNNIIDEIESIVYADMSNIDVRISIQEKLDKLKELKGEIKWIK